MSDKKTIQINPDLFSVNGRGGTRKKKPNDPNKPIKIRSENTKNNRTTKGKILRYIREQQQENYEKLFNEKRNDNKNMEPISLAQLHTEGLAQEGLDGASEFENSINYFKSMEEEKRAKNQHNHTVRQYPHNSSSVLTSHPYELENMSNTIPIHMGQSVPINFHTRQMPPPTYGCLKNGNLPTYRAMLQQTRKNHEPQPATIQNLQVISTNSMQPQMVFPIPISNTANNKLPDSIQSLQGLQSLPKTERERIEELKREQNERLKKISELKQIKQLVTTGNNPTPNKLKYLKRKRTMKRTFYIGKSKVFPKVGVLVSNKTIRKNVATKAQLLKQVPMEEIKKFLIKKGFIKIGTTAPNDVLRKIYESAIMMGGEIQNYNSENLLFNYLNEA
jgi:hypothetical protein